MKGKMLVKSVCLVVLAVMSLLVMGCPAKTVTRQDNEALKKEILTATLKSLDQWNQKNATDPEFVLAYYWEPKDENSRKNLSEFLYCLSDPKFTEKDKLGVIMYSKGDDDDLWPVLTEIFYGLQDDIPDLEKFLKTIRWSVDTEANMDIEWPADKDLPWFTFAKWVNGKIVVIWSTPVAEVPVPWVREEITPNAIDFLMDMAGTKDPKF